MTSPFFYEWKYNDIRNCPHTNLGNYGFHLRVARHLDRTLAEKGVQIEVKSDAVFVCASAHSPVFGCPLVSHDFAQTAFGHLHVSSC